MQMSIRFSLTMTNISLWSIQFRKVVDRSFLAGGPEIAGTISNAELESPTQLPRSYQCLELSSQCLSIHDSAVPHNPVC